MIDGFLSALAEQAGIVVFLVVAILCALCGGPWRFCIRMLAIAAAVCMALASFCWLMDYASREILRKLRIASRDFFRKIPEAIRHSAKEVLANRRDALREMGEKA